MDFLALGNSSMNHGYGLRTNDPFDTMGACLFNKVVSSLLEFSTSSFTSLVWSLITGKFANSSLKEHMSVFLVFLVFSILAYFIVQ